MLFKHYTCEAGQTGRGSPSGRGVPALDVHKPWWDRALSTQLWLRGAGGDLPQLLPTTILGFGSSVRQGALFFLPCPSEEIYPDARKALCSPDKSHPSEQ